MVELEELGPDFDIGINYEGPPPPTRFGLDMRGFSGFVAGKWRGAGVRLLTHSNCETQAQVYRG